SRVLDAFDCKIQRAVLYPFKVLFKIELPMNAPQADSASTQSKDRPCIYIFGPFQLNPTGHELLKNGNAVPLTGKAFQVLLALIEKAGRIVTKDHLMGTVWPDTAVEEANLSVQISTLRKSLGDEDETYIKTVPGVGYKFVAQVQSVPEG